MKNYGPENTRHQLPHSSYDGSPLMDGVKSPKARFAVEEKEEEVRRAATRNPFVLSYLGILAAMKVMIYYLSKSLLQ